MGTGSNECDAPPLQNNTPLRVPGAAAGASKSYRFFVLAGRKRRPRKTTVRLRQTLGRSISPGSWIVLENKLERRRPFAYPVPSVASCETAIDRSDDLALPEFRSDSPIRQTMIIVNCEHLEGHEIVQYLGIVRGSTVRSKHVGKDILAGIRSVFGGELKQYTEMMNESRMQSLTRMIEDATELGADAIINVRFATSQIMQGSAELLVYGTAVKIRVKG